MVLLYQLWLALSERKVMNKNRVNGSIVEKNGIWYARLYVTDEKGEVVFDSIDTSSVKTIDIYNTAQ